MGQSIVQIQQMGDALRSSGYKSIDSAVAEIVDNSIEAEAQDVLIIMRELVDEESGKKAVCEFGILDNGSGMDVHRLASCLGIGFTTKEDRRGMGRFGVGLPQASLHVTPRVEVYSWTEDIEDALMVWLDIEKVKTGEQDEIADPVPADIPEIFKEFIRFRTEKRNYNFTKHGTLVYWKDCDNVKPKTMAALNRRFEFSLGRKFRHLICNGTHNIRLITIGHKEEAIDILPNDPLFLMNPNVVLGNIEDPSTVSPRINTGCTEAIFEPYGDEVRIPIEYVDKKTREKKVSNVIVHFSKVRPEFYDRTAIPSGDPGGKPLGKYVKKLEGISVVRANREIDFGDFDFYDKTNNPHDRWWGCEIMFDPVLDELFGVANNKQQVELSVDILEQERGEDKGNLYADLFNVINGTIKTLRKENSKLREGSRSKASEDPPSKPSESIANDDGEKYEDDSGEAQKNRSSLTEEEREKKAAEYLESQGEVPTAERIRELLNKELSIRYADLRKNGPFFDVELSFGNISVAINTSHIFYDEFISKMDAEARVAFELFVAALAKAINTTASRNSEENDELLMEWDIRLKRYLKQIKVN